MIRILTTKKTNTKMQDSAILEVFIKYHQKIFEADFFWGFVLFMGQQL